MFMIALYVALFLISLSILGSLYRVIMGPSMPDRVMALDLIGINVIASVAILSVILKTHAFLDIILLIGILSFIGTIAYSRFIERGVIIEQNRDE